MVYILFMGGATGSIEFQNPSEQLQLSALVDRFCSRTANEFDPAIHVDEAKEIVRKLAPRIKLFSSGNFMITWGKPSSSQSSQVTGITDLGEVTTTVQQNQAEKQLKQKVVTGEQNIYKVGSYAITKVELSVGSEPAVSLQFKHYMKHGLANKAMGKFLPYWEIIYFPKDLELAAISETSTPILPRRKGIFLNSPGIYETGIKRQIVWMNPKKGHKTISNFLHNTATNVKALIADLKVNVAKRIR